MPYVASLSSGLSHLKTVELLEDKVELVGGLGRQNGLASERGGPPAKWRCSLSETAVS
jgi:hypothetical protein